MKGIENLGYEDIKIHINVSIIQLLRDSFSDDILRIVEQRGVNPSNLCLEITETVFTSNFKSINERLHHFRELGFSIALDDFGAGYSSLSRERELNVNYLKLDKHFIADLSSACKKTIVGDIISMAHKLGHYVIAEGVENNAQKDKVNTNATTCKGICSAAFSDTAPLLSDRLGRNVSPQASTG